MIRKQRLHTLSSRLLITRCIKSNRRRPAIDKKNADAQNSANIAKQQAANDRAQELQDRELVRGQQKALQQPHNAERSRSARTPKYTTVLHPLPVVRPQPSSPHK